MTNPGSLTMGFAGVNPRHNQRKAVGAYLGSFHPAAQALQSKVEGIWYLAACDHLQSGAQFFDTQPPSANPSGISGIRHVADPVNSALQREHSDLEPSGHKIN